MSSPCQPLPQSLAEEMLQVVARAICDRPGDSSTQRDSRTRQMVHSVLGFEPRDGLEYMLSTIAFGHFQLILDSMRDVFHGQTDALKARTKTTIVALDRAMLEMVRELRFSGRRPTARSAEQASFEAGDEVRSSGPPPPSVNEQVAAELPASVIVAAEPVAAPILALGQAPGTPAASRPVKIAPASSRLARSAPPLSRESIAPPADGRRADLRTGDKVSAGARVAASALLRDTADAISHSASTSPNESDEAMMRNHMAAFEAAFAATIDTLAESKALENAREGAKAATGD
jgi:hypothetical protein